MRGSIPWIAFVVGLAPAGLAQDSHSSHQIPIIPAELLQRPLPLRDGIGHAHDAVSTSSPEAQKFYDQGLAYLHDYVWIEAARSFHQALRLDPAIALAYVGLSDAYAEVNQPDAARQALERARALAESANGHDRRHVLVRERQMAAEDAPLDASRLAAYRKALDEALAEFPDDVELWLQRGGAEAPTAADRGQGSTGASVPYYAHALELAPDHFAAHHYLTHAFENTGRVEEALVHGASFARLAPGVPHARHMYGHDLRRIGRVQDAIAEFEAADRLETGYFSAEKIPPEYDWHYEHNLDLLAMSYQYTGQVSKAQSILKRAFELPTASLVQAFNKREWPMFLRSRGRGDEALAAARTLIAHPNLVVQASGHVEAGMARLVKHQFAEAAAEANLALTAMRGAHAGSGLVALPFEELQGEFFLLTGQREKGRTMLEAMIEKARAAPGPDEWSQALFMLESVARVARDAGDWEFAGRTANQMLQHDPAYAGTHFALALVADHDGNRSAAADEFALAEKFWTNANRDLPELREIRRGLSTREPR